MDDGAHNASSQLNDWTSCTSCLRLLDRDLNSPSDSLMLSSFPSELFPIITSLIPLRSAPRTLLSLSLVNHDVYRITHRLLYARLVLRNEDTAISVIGKILDEPKLGRAVTELYIMAELSVETRQGKKPFDVVDGLQMLVKKKLLPRLVALGIHLLNGWVYDENYKPIISHGRLLQDFWSTLRVECPRLQSLSLRNVGHAFGDPYLSGPTLNELLSLTKLSTLRLEWKEQGLPKADELKVFDNLHQLAMSLHTLSLHCEYQEVDQIMIIDFPNLKWLHLDCFSTGDADDPSVIMAFFCRHPQLESLSLTECMNDWFSPEVEAGFLPNLKHLKARFQDIRHLSSILPQLISLAFTESYNCQVPYLLRAVIQGGLPMLRSLEIEQTMAGWDQHSNEGALWYETVDGRFHKETKKRKVTRTFMNDYMHSIVRGAPNLEELGLHGIPLNAPALARFGPTLAQLVNLKRFYYRGFATLPTYGSPPPEENHEVLISDFLSSAETLARTCTGLEKVISIGGTYLPYLSAIIERDSTGNVTGVKRTYGVGMEIPVQDDEPFPYNT